MLIVPSLIALARESAPGITLQIANISANLAQALDQQQVDIALGAFDRVPPSLRSEVLFRDEKVWATGTHHPLAKQPFDHATVLAWLRLAIGIGSAGLKSREPPAGNDLVLRLILETDDEAISPRSAKRASASRSR
jgi:DNA-binding transcriptional LysR family regulator